MPQVCSREVKSSARPRAFNEILVSSPTVNGGDSLSTLECMYTTLDILSRPSTNQMLIEVPTKIRNAPPLVSNSASIKCGFRPILSFPNIETFADTET